MDNLRRKNMELLSVVTMPDSFDVVLEVKHKRWLLKSYVCRYIGSGTVWHKLPECIRCNSSLEETLCDFAKCYKHRSVIQDAG